jgi:RimJ/RimL family protein N-acetyltransferase
MTDAASLCAGLSLPASLRDGTPVQVRAVRPDDRQRIVDAFHKLAPETIYTRFFSAKKELTEADLGRIEASDFVRAVSLVVTLAQGGDEVIIGGGAYTVLDHPGELPSAELSFTIEEDYQGQGLSTLLMRLLTQVGRERGIRRFEAEVLAGNAPMLRVFERCGLAMQTRAEDGVVFVQMSLDPAGPAAPAG